MKVLAKSGSGADGGTSSEGWLDLGFSVPKALQ